MWLLIGAISVGGIVALIFVIPQAPVSELQGTAPSVLDTQLQPSAHAGLPEPLKEECFAKREAGAPTGAGPGDALTRGASGSAADAGSDKAAVSGGISGAPGDQR